jgi:hypothetical protein
VTKFKILFVVACSLGLAPPAFAQPTPSGPVGMYVAALGGAVFDPRTTSSFGIEVGDIIGENIEAYATLSYFHDLMDTTLRRDLTLLNEALSSTTGRPWALSGRDRGIGFIVGAKFVGGTRARPYVGGGAGMLNLRRRITDPQVGDVTQATLSDFGIGDAGLAEGVTKPMIEGTAGIGVGVGVARVDVGYRYRRVFQLSQPMDFSQFAIGVGVNF